ncbi:hypothetical protein [Teredinibacter turnerae]|uniref:hypothetical protein n=1 Tax=Teredinibacter turnerae TaxID=2426 RepID=UPI0003763A1E|nr:hypothetical protein [Teredinibacter turnerae]
MRIDKNVISGKYRKLYYCISAILFANDIEGINFETNDDEYEPEVETILPRLPETETIEDIQVVVQEEFARWFGDKRELDEFYIVAKEIWAAWNTYKSGMS